MKGYIEVKNITVKKRRQTTKLSSQITHLVNISRGHLHDKFLVKWNLKDNKEQRMI